MHVFIIRRVAQGMLTLVLASALIYSLLMLIPGGPFEGEGALRMPSEARLRLNAYFGIADAHGHK